MNVNVELATFSNLMIYSAMAVYLVAFLIAAIDLFASEPATRESTVRRSTRRRRVSVGAGASGAEASDAETADSSSGGAGMTTAVAARSGRAARSAATAQVDAGSKAGSGESSGDASASRGPRRLARISTALIALAVALHVAAVVLRTVSVMRVPWGNMMEYALTTTALIGIAYLIALRYRDLRFLGTFVSGALLLSLGLCITVLYTPAAQLVPALDSYWILIHVPVAILSTVLLYISAGLTLFQLAKHSRERNPSSHRALAFLDRLPSSDSIERLAYRVAAMGFITWTFTLIAGAVWAEFAWGRYWGWDTKEVWTFVVWVVYAAYLHARATRGWSALSIGLLNLVGFASVVFNFTIVNVYFNGLHSYSGLE